MERRTFLKSALAAGAAASLGSAAQAQEAQAGASKPFKLKYAPHEGMFKFSAGEDYLDQLRFAADLGFTAWEDNGMGGRPVDFQKQAAQEMQRLNITMGVFVAGFDFAEKSFVTNDQAIRDSLVERMKWAVETAQRLNAQWCTVVPGAYDPGLAWEYQTANVIENLKWCAGVLEPSGLVMVLEPLNWLANHPGLFLQRIPQAYEICRAVGSPSCKILDDLYHQQVTEGNLIPNMEKAWDEIAYIQIGDNPGRNQPTTGEINFKNIFKWLHQRGYQGVVGMEHGIVNHNSKQAEQALIDAYRYCDSFPT